MAKSKKKNIITLIILLITLVLLIVLAVSLSNKNNKDSVEENVTEEGQVTELMAIDIDQVTDISFENEYGSFYYIKNTDGQWINGDNEETPVNESTIKNIENKIKSINYNRLIPQETGDLTEFGLEDPAIVVTINLDDGTSINLKFGIEAPAYSGRYMMLNDNSDIYLVDSSLYNAFDKNETHLVEYEDLPSIDGNNIRYINIISNDKSELEMRYNEEELGYTASSNWEITQPYENVQLGDNSAILEYLGNYSSLSFDQGIDYEVEDLGKYGLDDPAYTIYLEYFEIVEVEDDDENEDTSEEVETMTVDHTLELQIGSTNESGDYYVKTADSDSVGILSESSVNNLVDINPFTLLDKYFSMINIISVDSIEIKTEDQVHVMDIERETVTTTEDGEDKEELVEEYYINDELVEDSEFKSIYQAIIRVSGEQEVAEDYEIGNEEPVLTITFHRNTEEYETVEIKYYPYDDSYYAVDINGNIIYLVDLRNINAIVDLF